ncbi:MAG: GDSL-type esterase/lipase family protein [Saprospiraceae bacterium]
MNRLFLLLLIQTVILNISCTKKEMINYPANSNLFQWHGRTVQDPSGNRLLISSASSLRFRFAGGQCRIWLKNIAPPDKYNYISIVLDGVHQGRRAIKVDTFSVIELKPLTKSPFHEVELYKETEPVLGAIIIRNVEADSLLQMPKTEKKKIEFIGNSVTVGMYDDESLVPCGGGTWFDQHNAYDAYGPKVARALDLDYIVNGVSGIGMYRNWNTDGPTMNDVYEQEFMNGNPNGLQWDFKQFTPDIVTICLGTNDISDGDGVTPRKPFDSSMYINVYVSFIEKIHHYYPEAAVLLLNTPMEDNYNTDILNHCLDAVKEKAQASIENLKPVSVFTFTKFSPGGCGGHPDLKDQKRMADELIPVIQKLL